MQRNRDDLFRVVTRRDVPYINNACGRALRPSVIFRKVTNCLRAERGALVGGERHGYRTIARTYLDRGAPCRACWRADYAIRVIVPLGVSKYALRTPGFAGTFGVAVE